MSCVNINSPEFKSLTEGMDNRQRFVAKAVISKYMTDNDNKFPSFIELKSLISDLYNTNQGGVDYTSFYNEVKDTFRRLLPGMSEVELDERVKFVDKLELIRLRNGKPVLTSFINNVTYISTSLLQERGTQAYTDVRHEIFHVIFNNFLSETEQERMMESFKRWKPQYANIMDKEELEEKMADTFENYKINPQKTIPILIRDFFQKLLKFFGLIGSHYNDIKALFDDVENGKFTRNYLRDSLVTRDKTILSKYSEFSTNLDLFLQSKAFVMNNLNELMYPDTNRNLTEKDNNSLFLNYDNYSSPLFQNNKDVFKLGLTKNDALKQLQRRIKALKDSKTLDPQLSNVVNVLSKPYILKDLFDYLQPFSLATVTSEGELVLKSQVEEDPDIEVNLEESDEQINSLEIGSKELINPTTKISEVVKDFLSSITYETTPGNFVAIDPGVGFISLLNMLGGMYGNTSISDNLTSLNTAYDELIKGNQTKAVYEKLVKLHNDVIGYNRITLNVKGVSSSELEKLTNQLDQNSIKYEKFKDTLTVLIPDNMRIENQGTNNVDNEVVFTYNRFKEGGKSFLIKQILSGKNKESNKTFIEKVANETGIPAFIIAKLFKYNEQRNQLAEVTKVANSLRKLSPKFVKVQTNRVEDQESGEVSTAVSYAFINKVSEFRNATSLASELRDRLDIISTRRNVVNLVQTYSTIKDSKNREDVRSLLKSIVVDGLGLLLESDFEKIKNKDAQSLMNTLEKVINFVPEIKTDAPASEFGTSSDLFLRHTSKFASALTNYTVEKNNPTSFGVSTSNKQKWENVMSNTSNKIFKNLQKFGNKEVKFSNVLPFLRNSFNNYLRYNPLLTQNYSDSTFTVNEDLLRVRDEDFYADHQETYFENKYSNYELPPVPFSKETPRDWINRNFLAMFQLPILEDTSKKKDYSYFQQKFQPESAPNVSIVKMGINSAENLRSGFKHMIIQEAYMHFIGSKSTRKNIAKNTEKSMLPGLEGSTYFMKNGENIFFNGDGYLDPKYGTIVNGKLKVGESKELNNLVDTILESLDGSMDSFIDTIIEEKATLDGTSIADLYNKISYTYIDRYKLSPSELNTLRNLSIDSKANIESLVSSENWTETKQALKKAMSSYYLNSYVNGYFMNQLSSGSTQNYKNPLDEIKRQAGVNAMNDTGLIDNKHGMKTNYKNIVIAAANNFYGESHPFANIPLLQRFFRNKEQEIGDAQSWDLPEYKRLLRKSFGKSVDIGVITKDVHFEINEDGYVDYRKTSSAELTNELVRNNKTLRDLRYALTFSRYLKSLSDEDRANIQPRIDYLYNKLVDEGALRNVDEYMEYENILQDIIDGDFMIHKASFESAIKGSKPAKLSEFIKNEETGTFDFRVEDTSIIDLNSTYTGIQQAIRHRYIDSFISHFTQLTYLIGLNRTETSIKNNRIITRTLSRFAKAGIFDSLFDYKMRYGDDKLLRVNTRSKKEFIKDLVKKLDLPGNERIVALLRTPKISMNNPLFSEKLMQSFFSSLSKKTVAPKHPGGSFVLQSEFGFEANKVLQENSLRKPELVIDSNGNVLYAECYLPEMYSQQMQAGSLIYYNSDEYNKMFGFRIPSSDLHSSVPLKVIGYYPTPVRNGVPSHDNVIVIPSAVTALHGSDFDVDKLFVVRYGVFGEDDEDIDPKAADQTPEEPNVRKEYKTRFQPNNVAIAQKGIKYGYTAPEAQYNEKGNLVSFGIDDKHVQVFNMDSVLLNEKESTQNKILEVEKRIVEEDKIKPANLAEKAKKIKARNQLMAELDSLNKHLKTLRTIQKGFYSNQILDAVLDNISYAGENAEDIFFGITFDPVKGYEETSEYSELARVYSDINKAKGVGELLPERPKLYKTLQEAQDGDPVLYTRIENQLRKNLGVNPSIKEGQVDHLALINDKLQNDWIADRDEFIRTQRGSKAVNINKVEQHVTVHKETYMAAGLVGLIANFSKGLAYAFHGITDDQNSIELDIADDEAVTIDGQKFNKFVLTNKDGIKTQELRSLALNAAIDHVKEQILNVLNVGNNTAKIFLAAISTEMNLHQATMILLQPVAKELNSSNATTVASTLNSMAEMIQTRLNELQQPISEEDLTNTEITTKGLEKFITTSFSELFNNTENKSYRKDLLTQFKIIRQLSTLNRMGNEVSDISGSLSIIQGLPYNLESAYDKLKAMDKFINVQKFYEGLKYTEKSEYYEPGFKDTLRSNKNILRNVNLANNENILGALESIKTQIDVVSEIFTENSIQAQFLVNNMLKAVSNNSDPSTMFTGENDIPLSFDTTANVSINDKYLKGKNTFNVFKVISRNIFNYITSGLNISYNNDQHLFSLGIKDQNLLTVRDKRGNEFQYGPVRSYINSFLMQEGDLYDSTKNYNGNNFVVSQINPEWRVKPLSLIKRQNLSNKFLRNLGIDTNFRDNVRIMTFNSALVNTAENLAEIEKAVNELNTLKNIYVRLDKKGRWVDVPSSLHPETSEMNEVTFNILKTSLYTDKFKFSSSKATNVIPPIYFRGIFRALETLTKDLIYYDVNPEGNKYYKDFTDLTNVENQTSAIENIKENLFINTILSIPTVLPNLKSILPRATDRWKMINRQAGILNNGNIYDLYFDANILDKKDPQEEQQDQTMNSIEKTNENTNLEVDQDVSESQAETDLFEQFRKNPSFIANEDQDRNGNFEIYMKVGSTGSKETNDLKYYYKRLGNVNGKMTNNSFDLNLLLNRYRINEYFNPKRFAIPVRGQDFSGDRITLTDIKISSFLTNASDDIRTRNQNKQEVASSEQQQFEVLRADPKNKNKTDAQLRSEIKTKINVENVINQVNEVSLFDSRSIDRVGMRHFRILSRQISNDKSSITLELEALPRGQQIEFLKFDSPLDILRTVKEEKILTREEKIEYINSIPGAKVITKATALEMTDAQINQEYEKALELDQTKEVNDVIKNKSCK